MQWEFAWSLGPESGRYPVRSRQEEDPAWVVVFSPVEATGRLSRRSRRKKVREARRLTVEIQRVTVIDSSTSLSADTAQQQLAACRGEAAQNAVDEALLVLNRVLSNWRVASTNPYVRELSPTDALVTRIGYGNGQSVADGHWLEAYELTGGGKRRNRHSLLSPYERFTSLLNARERPLACEELALRARLDLNQGREREAALQLELALQAAVEELPSSDLPAELDQAEPREALEKLETALRAHYLEPLGSKSRSSLSQSR